MNFNQKIALLLLLTVVTAQIPHTPLQILFVSSDPSTITNPIYSSLRGGKMIYIKAMGHSPTPSDNLVYIGTFPCKIPSDGVTDTFISCVTGDSASTTDINNLPVTLISQGTSTTTSSPNIVSYQKAYTPQLAAVYPTAGYGGSNVNLYGVHGISNIGDGMRNMGDITKLMLGNDLCSRFDVLQGDISDSSSEYILCV